MHELVQVDLAVAVEIRAPKRRVPVALSLSKGVGDDGVGASARRASVAVPPARTAGMSEEGIEGGIQGWEVFRAEKSAHARVERGKQAHSTLELSTGEWRQGVDVGEGAAVRREHDPVQMASRILVARGEDALLDGHRTALRRRREPRPRHTRRRWLHHARHSNCSR